MARQYKFTTAVNKVRKNNNDTGISNFDEAVESIRANRQSTDYLTEIDRENRHKAYEESQRQARLRAIELAKTSTSSANAGDNRTTEYNKPQTMSVYGGLGTLPNPTTQGMNTAANGANIDYSKVNENASKGWKGISALNGTKAKDKTISQEESLAHATEVMKPYTKNAKAMDILNRYSELEDSQDRNGMLNFQSIGAYSGQFDKLANDFINETGVSMDEFRQIAENYSYIKHSDERNAAKAKKKDAGIVANIAQGIGEAAISPLTNYQAMIGAMQNPNDPELGRDYNSPFMKHLNAQADTKEAFQAKTESLSPVAKTLANLGYDLTVTGTQSAAAALTGEVGLGSFAAGGYSQTLQESDERGLSEGQAQVYSAISGGLEYITERLPIEHLKKIYNGNIGKSATGSLKPYIKAALEQMGEEASEELVNGIADTITDGLINGDKSKVNTAIQNNINSGMSEEEATKSAYLDVVKNTGYSMLVAALSTGVSAGPALATQAIETTRAGRDIIKDNKPLTRDTESSYYISEDRSDYVADEDYEQAQDARQTILNASEKSDKGERVSGKEARAVYEKATRALESLNARRNVEAVKAEEGITNTSGEEEQVEYKAPEKTNEEIIEDIEFASTPYQLAQAIDQVTEETDEIKELIEYKRQELEMYNFKSSDVDNAVTEKKAFEMGQRGEAVSEEQLNAIPEADRQKILEANNQAYNKSILAEHPDAVADTRTGKYFVPEAVKINGADVVIIDSEGNEHTDYSNPRINQALSVATLTSKDARGHLTSESMYKSTPRQAAYAIGLAIKSPEATSALIRTAVEAIYNSASVGHTTFEEFEKNSKGLFTKVDRDEARFLYNAISEEARKSDTRKTENTEGKKTSEKAVSDTLREALPEETTALLEALSNKIGYNFVASTNKNARGSINPGTRQISIGTNSIDEVWSIVAHEAIGEYLQAHGKEDDVLAIQDDMFKYLEGKLGSDAFNDLINQYQSVYRTGAKEGSVDYGKSRRAAANEMFNDTIFALISSEEGVKDYVSWLNERHEKSFLEKVKDFFNKIVESIRNYIDTGSFNAAERAALEMDYDQAKAMRDRIFKAMDEAIARANNNEESNDNSNESVEETVRNSFAGINSKTADRQMLERAKDMFYEDMNDIDILAETGWFLGADNYWRYEIADNDAVIFNKGNAKYVQNNKDYARYNELMDKIFFSMDSEYSAEEYAELEELDKKIDLKSAARKTEGKLPDFLYHEELYKAYPFLENVNVKIEKSDFFRGQFNQKTNTITISADLANNIITDNGFKSTLMHEVQHAIQAAEGFASGSTENYWKNHKQELLESDKEDLEHAKDRLKDEQERAKALNEPTSTQEFADQYNLEYLNEDFDNELERFKKDFKEWRKGNIYYYEDIIKKLQRHIDLLENYSDRYLYEYTAGEIEARDVQDRLDYTKEERRRNLPNQEVFDTVYANDRMISGRRYSIKVDSEGRELSEGQQEYFKNSKVVDEEGRLKVVYYGTMADFNIFDLKEARDTEDIEAFFFSGDYEESSGYGNVGEYYLNIINPADYDIAYDIFFKHKGKEHAGRLAREELQSMGYDGVIAVDEDSPEYTEYLVFDSKQIKRVDNKKPTDNLDIRKSIKVDNQGRDIAPGMQQYLSDNADAFYDENGAVKNYYHGTRNAGFTAFNLDMMDDQRSIFLTDSKDVAKTYSGTHEMFEPDREWSYEELENAISFFTGGDWEVEKTDNGVRITELGFIGEEGTTTTFNSISEAQKYLVDWIQTQDMISGGDNGAIYNVYVHSTNPLVIDARNQRWDEIEPWEYDKHLVDVNITRNDDVYEVDYANVEGEYFHETYNSREEFEDNFSVLPEDYDIPDEGEYYEDLYLDKDRNIIPSNTRAMSAYAKEHGYDSLVINNVVDSGLFGSTAEQNLTSQVVVVFDPSQVKSVYNENPSAGDEDIRKSIRVDWDNKNTYKLPDRTYEDDIFFLGTDEEIEAAEKQEITAKAYVANIIHSKDFAGLMFKDSIGIDRLLTRSTRKEWDWQLSESRNGEPIGHENYKEENDDITSYDTWPDKTMAALYNEIINELPKSDAKIYVIREGIAEDARNSIKVYGEASPYADSINETKVISTMLGSMNNSLSQVDAFNVSNDAYMQIEKSILNKYNAKLEEGELAANVSFAFAYMQQNKLETNYEKMMNYLLNIGDEVIKNSNLKDPESEQMYNSAKEVVKNYTFKLSEADRQEIKNAFGGNWKSAFGELQKAGIKLNNEKGVDIDTVFSQLQEEFLQSAGINLEKYDKPSEQILGLLDAMHALEPTAYLWDGANSMDKALTVVSDIINDYYSIATGQLASNVVKGTKKGKDIITAAINKEKSKLNQKFKEYKDNKTDEFNQIVAEKNRIIQEQQQKLKAQNEQMKKWNAELSETERKLQQGKLLTEKQVRQTAKLQAKEAVESYRQREERARQIENIKKTGIRLIKWLDNPTDNQHVPKFLQRPLAEFLSAIDFLPKNAKADSKSTLTWQQRMQSLRQALVKIKDAEAEADGSPEAYFAQNMIAKELLSMMDDFLGAETFDEFTQSYIVTKRAAKKVSLLDAKELATLNKIMSALSASINNMNKTYANAQFEQISKLARESVKEVDALPAKKDMQKMLGRVFNFLNFDEVEPITYFEGLGSGAKSVYQELRDGFNLKTKHVREADAYMDAAKKELGITDKELSTWKNQLHTFKLTEGTVMLNTTQIMSLYKIIGRRQGKPHVAVGGIKSADFEYKDGKVMKKHHQAKAVHIRASEANAIINTLTPEQKALADKMQKFMASDCAKWGNRVTEKMFGYKKYEEEDYFPLKTDAHSRATTASSDNNVSYYTIKNSSFTKPITPMANNAVVLDDIFDVFTDHVVSMADYDAYVMPIADAMRWFNYSERVINAVAPDELNEQGARLDYIGNMQESIDRVYGDAGLNYFRQFIKDINGDYAGTGGTNELLSSLMSMYKAQAVGANMRVVIQQPTAVVRASDVIEPTYLLQAMASLPKAAEYAKKAQANSEIAYWKAQGYYETYLGQSFKEIITGDVTLKDKFNDWSGYLAGKADDLSWGIMYKAAELKTAKEQPELKGSAFDKAATKLFEDIVDHTQVVDTIFHKSQYMRNQGTGYKVTSAFMAEPTKTYNMLYRAYRDAKLSGNQSFKVKRLRDVALIFLFEQILNAIITGGWDVLRDDEKTNYIESFREHFTENALDNLNPLNLLPIAKEITSAIQGYDATAYTIDAIYTAVDSFNALLKIAQGKSNKTTWGNTYQIAKATSQLTGVPVANVMREFKTIYNLVNDFWGGKDLINSKTIQKKVEKTKETNRLSKVFEAGDLGSIKSEITNTYNNAIADGKEESEAWKATREMLKSQYQLLVEANPEDMAAINNRFKTLLKYTKKADGKGGYRLPSDKEVANWIDNWKVED